MRQFPAMRRYLLLLALAGLSASATAQLRTIPQEAQRGEIRHLEGMLVEIDGKEQRLSPGAQIRDADNRVVLPAYLPEKSVVKYLIDASGMVHRVWILSAREQAENPVTLPFPK
jgi:hypothetical protein